MKKFFKFLITIILLGGLIYLYGTYLEPNLIITHEYKIKKEDLSDNFEGFTIAHISDIKYTKERKDNLKKLVKDVNEYKPDIIVLTGDLFKKNQKIDTDDITFISDQINKLKAKEDIYIIKGDEDIKYDEWKNIISLTKIKDLDNTYDTIYKNGYDYILISGISTKEEKEDINTKNKPAKDFIDSVKEKPIYKILLLHEPDYVDELNENNEDLILAGHYMGCNINIPYIKDFLTKDGFKTYHNSYYKINNSDMYISNGIGQDFINFRLFNTPSFNIYRLVKE